MTDRLFFEVEGVAHEIALTRDYAPRTVDSILACLPLEVTIHCAKIAGNHIMWPMPFLQRLETAADVLDAPPGAFLFWPDRQYLEIVYAPLQAETAAINLLGEMTDGVDWLADYADRQRRLHGHKTFTARMYVDSWRVPAPPALPEGEDPWSRLRAARLAAWASEPECVDEVMRRRGLNIPFGPLAIVEGELRRTHELLWRLWNDETRYQAADKAMIARATLELAAARIAGFCHLPEIGARFEDGIACLGGDDGPDVQAVLEELVLYAGRMAAWFDLRICWHPMNELTLGVLESEAAGGAVRG